MTVEDVRKTLEDEVKYLDHLIECAEGFDDPNFTKQAKYIRGSWIRFLNDRRTSNKNLVSVDDDVLREDLQAELEQVTRYQGVTADDPEYTETWAKFIDCEAEILDHLIKDFDR
ncbi:MAG: hypothetical protein ACR2OR_06300 [Hyphomicrobiales bacterium]